MLVIGAPLGLSSSISDGIVSATRILDGVSLVQITAPISRGSSGSPVINGSGAVIGVATFVFSGGQNVNFAVVPFQIRDALAKAKESSSDRESTPERSAASDRTKISQLLELLRQRPLDVSLYQELAKAYAANRQVAQAIEMMKTALGLETARADDYRYLSRLYTDSGRVADAIQCLESGLIKYPDSRTLRAALAFSLNSSKEKSDTLRSLLIFRELITSNPADPSSYSGMALSYKKLGNMAEAIQTYRDLIEQATAGKENGYYELSKLLGNEEAEKTFRAYANRYPDEAYVKYILGGVLLAGNKKSDAIRIYEQLRTQDARLGAALFTQIFGN